MSSYLKKITHVIDEVSLASIDAFLDFCEEKGFNAADLKPLVEEFGKGFDSSKLKKKTVAREPSRYQLFAQAKRPELKARFPKATPTELMKMVGEEWQKAKAAGEGTSPAASKVSTAPPAPKGSRKSK